MSAAIASSGADNGTDQEITAALGVSQAGVDLAFSAWSAVAETMGWPADIGGAELDAEAECLLRDGWSPGDETRRLREGWSRAR